MNEINKTLVDDGRSIDRLLQSIILWIVMFMYDAEVSILKSYLRLIMVYHTNLITRQKFPEYFTHCQYTDIEETC